MTYRPRWPLDKEWLGAKPRGMAGDGNDDENMLQAGREQARGARGSSTKVRHLMLAWDIWAERKWSGATCVEQMACSACGTYLGSSNTMNP